jgi:hypothetical protein
MRAMAKTGVSKKDIRTRQHLMERTFAYAQRYGFKRARWRKLWRVQIQEYITAAIQNIQVLIRHGKDPTKLAAIAMSRVKMKGILTTLSAQFITLLLASVWRTEKDLRSYCDANL